MLAWLRQNAAWIGIAATLTAGVSGVYVRAAFASTDTRLAITERDIGDLKGYLERREARDRKMQEKLDALCRATPNAKCPLGVE